MSTKIDYVTGTWSPIAMRCARTSPGCANCWHLRMCTRHAANPRLPEVLRTARAGGRFVLMKDVLDKPLHWKRPRRIGIQYMGDWLHERVKPHWIDAILEVVCACPQHTFLSLSKRIGNYHAKVYDSTLDCSCRELGGGDYLPNLWNGITVCTQEEADRDIPILLRTLSAMRWVSLEPLLSPVGLAYHFPSAHGMRNDQFWIVVGCETIGSRPGRECKLNWIKSVVDQCHDAGVAMWVKQVSYEGKVIHDAGQIADLLGTTVEQIRQWPKGRT